MRITCEHCQCLMELEHTDTCGVCNKSHFLEPSKDEVYLRCIKEIRINADECCLVMDGFDGCLVGTDNQKRLVYDIDLIRTVLKSNLGLSIVDADELIQSLIDIESNKTLPPVFVSLNHELLNYQYSK